MQRLPFVMKIAPGRRAEVIAALRGSWGEINAALRRAGAENFSVWSIQDFLFCYGEYPDGVCPPAACGERWAAATADCEMFSFAAISLAVTPGITTTSRQVLSLLYINISEKSTKIFI